MNPGMRPAGIEPPDMAQEGALKSWLDALASGGCDAPAFLNAMKARFAADPDGTWEVLSQLDQYYRRGRIETEVFKSIKTALAESVLGHGPVATAREVPVAHDVVVPTRVEQTDAHPRREETQASDSLGEPTVGRVLRRRYRIEGIIGQGGMGTVFQVLDEFRLEAPGSQRLAVKILHPAVAKRAELLAELRREFQSLQSLSHPNVIRVFDFDRDGPLVFFTMELLTGAQLGRIMQARKLIRLERPQAFAILRDVGAALAYAHSRGAVHGDLDPQNIFVTGSGELRVMGFGASHKARHSTRAADHEMTLPLSGSCYASCQVLEGERADARDDVFSLACIAYWLLAGDHPFQKSSAIEAREAKLRPRRPANLSGRQWRALRAALRWERENRPTDVQRWLVELELRGAAKGSARLNDLLEPPLAREPRSWLAAGIAAGIAALLFTLYWVVSHRDLLPSIASTATISAPTSTVPPVASPAVASPAVASPAVASPAARSAAAPPVAAAPRPVPSIDRAKPPPAAAPPSAPISAPISAPAAHEAPVAAAVATPAAKAPAGASKVELAADTLDVSAGEASAQIAVHRKGNLRGETSFTWWTESGTAKPGTDFSAAVPQLAYFADGKSNVSLSVPVSNAPHAQSKSFYVVIDQSEGGATLGSRTLTMVTLLPSD